MTRTTLIAQHVLAGALVVAVLGAATAGLACEMLRRGCVRVWRWA